MSDVIIIDELTKIYPKQTRPAISDVSFKIKTGEIYGFLGANGAGKTTTIKLILNFIRPSNGTITILGLDSIKDTVKIKRQLGYLAGETALYQKFTGRQILDFLGSIQPVDKKYRQKLENDFEAELDKPIETLSKGNKQKIAIIQAIMHQPKILILDEPTSGLDPLMQEVFYDAIIGLSKTGSAILMSSHNLSEAQRICHNIGIIKNGLLVHQQQIDKDLNLLSDILKISLSDPSEINKFKQSQSFNIISQPDKLSFLIKPSKELNQVLKELSNFKIISLVNQKISLEDEFLNFYENKI